jgi:hypothetical protein
MGVTYSHYLIPQDNTVRPEPDRIIDLIHAWTEKGFIVPASGQASQATARFMTEQSPQEAVEQKQAAKPLSGFWARLWGKRTPMPHRPDPWKPFSVPPTGEALLALAKPNTVIRWKGNSNAVYPMRTLTELVSQGDHRFPHSLTIEMSDDFLNVNTDPYGVGEDTRQVNPICTCGCGLGYEDKMGWSTSQRIRQICPSCGSAFRPQDQLAEVVDGATGKKTSQPGGLCNRFAIVIDFGKEWPLYLPGTNGELLESTAKASDVFLETCSTALGIELNEFSLYG